MLTSRIQVGCQEYGCSFYVAAALRRCGLPGPCPRKERAAQMKACQPVSAFSADYIVRSQDWLRYNNRYSTMTRAALI
jgi:hypothetical protein